MSEKYYQCYFDTNENEGYENYLAFENLVKSKRWSDLVEKYGERLSRLVGCSSKNGSEKLNEQVEHYLDIVFSLDKNDTSYCLQFDTFTSLDEFEMLTFLKNLGFKRIETELENSSVGSVQYFLNEKEIDDCNSVSWKWIAPNPTQSEELLIEKNLEPEIIELPINDILTTKSDIKAQYEDCPTELLDLSNLAIQASLYKEYINIRGYLLLLTKETDGIKIMSIDASTSERTMEAANEYLDTNASDIEDYCLANFYFRQDHSNRSTPSQIVIESGRKDTLTSYSWLVSRETPTTFSSIEYYLSSTSRLKSALDELNLEPIVLGPTVRRLVVRVGLMVLGILFLPYIWAKALCFLAILYLNASFILRSRLTLSKSGFETKETAYSAAVIMELRDIECVRETTHDKIILMLSIKNKANGPGLRNFSELEDEEFKRVIKEYCSTCSIAYETLEEQP